MSTRWVGWLCAAVVGFGFLLTTFGVVKAEDDPRKEDARIKYSDFCANVKHPPVVSDLVKWWFQNHPDFAALGAWVEDVASKRAQRCNDV